ncbi:MAG: nucleoside deaminase [Clostridia bacterium]|nr:nucleoside deaminase [Clostridia bacterium]
MNYKEIFMTAALQEAEKAYKLGETPIGAVIVKDSEIIASAHNLRETGKNVLYHAELLAIDAACKALGGWRLHQCDLYVTLEPCIMCSGAISQSRIKNLYFGAPDPKGGAVLSAMNASAADELFCHTNCEGGILLDECSEILKKFFRELRSSKTKTDK